MEYDASVSPRENTTEYEIIGRDERGRVAGFIRRFCTKIHLEPFREYKIARYVNVNNNR